MHANASFRLRTSDKVPNSYLFFKWQLFNNESTKKPCGHFRKALILLELMMGLESAIGVCWSGSIDYEANLREFLVN